jgi:hypothetical protein
MILARPALVGIGLISYPLYLWHWPLLSFARIVEGETPSVSARVVLVALSVALAWTTYRAVERPIRLMVRPSFRMSAVLGAVSVVLVVGGVGTWVLGGFPYHIDLANRGEIVAEDGNEVFFAHQTERYYPCTPEPIRKNALRHLGSPRCLQSKPSERRDVAIIGDSHAEDLFIGLADTMVGANVVAYIQGVLPVRKSKEFNDIFAHVVSDQNIRVVVLGSNWAVRSQEVPKGSSLEAEITKTVRELVEAGRMVYLLDARPDFPFDPSVCKYWRPRFFWQERRAPRCDMDRSAFDTQRAMYHEILESIARKVPNVHVLETSGTFCDESSCRMASDGVLFFRDRNHLTIAGSRAVAARLGPLLEGGSRSSAAGADRLGKWHHE